MSCEACPPEQPPLPVDFALCGVFIDIVATETELFIYLASCEAVAALQFTITVDGEVFTDEVEGSGGAAAEMDIVSGNGIVVIVDVQGSITIPPSAFVLLTKLTQIVSTTFPVGEYCLEDLIISDVNGTAIPAFSSCTNFASACEMCSSPSG